MSCNKVNGLPVLATPPPYHFFLHNVRSFQHIKLLRCKIWILFVVSTHYGVGSDIKTLQGP